MYLEINTLVCLHDLLNDIDVRLDALVEQTTHSVGRDVLPRKGLVSEFSIIEVQ